MLCESQRRCSYIAIAQKSSQREEHHSPVAILPDSYRYLGLDDGVDTADLVRYLPGALEQEGLVDRSRHVSRCVGRSGCRGSLQGRRSGEWEREV